MSPLPPSDQPEERAGESAGRRPDGVSGGTTGAAAEGASRPAADDMWAAFARSAGSGRRVPKELSARERADVARRVAANAAATPPGWRTGPAWQEMNGTRPRRRLPAVLVLVAIVLVGVIVLWPELVLDRLPGGSGPAAAEAQASPLPAETALPSTAPEEVADPDLPTLTDPFRGSPTLSWADGEAGIELPTPKAVGGFGRDDVALALRRTKELLVATNLDPAVLGGAYPTDGLAVIDPVQKELKDDLDASLRAPEEKNEAISLISRFDPSDLRPAGEVVKVRGHMTFAAGEPGQIRVHADYTFVYPVARAEGGDETVARTIVRRDLTTVLADPSRWEATRGKLQVLRYDVETFNDECGVHDGWLHPVFPDGFATGQPADGPAADPYDRRRTLAEETRDGRCGTVTRT